MMPTANPLLRPSIKHQFPAQGPWNLNSLPYPPDERTQTAHTAPVQPHGSGFPSNNRKSVWFPDTMVMGRNY